MTNPYDAAHQQHRADWNQLIQHGAQPTCPRCNQPIQPGQAWDLGHTQDLTLGGRKQDRRPEHQTCNRSAGAELARTTPPSRTW